MKIKTIILIMIMLIMNGCSTNINNEIHVDCNVSISGDGSKEAPFKSIQEAINKIVPGTTVLIHEGNYDPFEIGKESSGTEHNPVIIKAFENEKVIINGIYGDQTVTIKMTNVDNITIDGLEVIGGAYGIYYSSNREQGNVALNNITISNCLVHGIRGTHGICVYACNDLAPVKNLVMRNCEVYDCRLDSSESTVFNGNIDGFEISNNVIHDNNNIGIDMIGFEGNASHDASYNGNLYDVDYVRNGMCFGNVVYNISAFDNHAYYYQGDYDLCADGIYVDGGQNIEIYNNFIYNADIGIEVATEHSKDDNELFKVTGIDVHDNIVSECMGWSGLAIGGYDKDLGYTLDCKFYHNTFINNDVGIAVQRTSNNLISNNLFIGGDLGIEYNTDIREKDLINEFKENLYYTDKDINDYFASYEYDINNLLDLDKQFITSDEVLDHYLPINNNYGSNYVPNKEVLDNYEAYINDGKIGIENTIDFLNHFLENGIDINSVTNDYTNICTYLNEVLIQNGLNNSTVELMKVKGSTGLFSLERDHTNGDINIEKYDENKKTTIEFHVRYRYDDNSWSHGWIKKVVIK